jgi:hypothetical protein
VVIVVDVLSFCTSVDIAVGRGAAVLPQRWGDRAAAVSEATALGALSAGPRSGAGPSLRPSSLLELSAGTRLALASPNGGTLCAIAADRGAAVFAGCLRNASAVAAAAERASAAGGSIGLVPAGERWPDGTLRVAAEDLIGAGHRRGAARVVPLPRGRARGRPSRGRPGPRAGRGARRAELGPRADRRRLRAGRGTGRGPGHEHGRPPVAGRSARGHLSGGWVHPGPGWSAGPG